MKKSFITSGPEQTVLNLSVILFTYLDDLVNIHSIYFEQMVDQKSLRSIF